MYLCRCMLCANLRVSIQPSEGASSVALRSRRSGQSLRRPPEPKTPNHKTTSLPLLPTSYPAPTALGLPHCHRARPSLLCTCCCSRTALSLSFSLIRSGVDYLLHDKISVFLSPLTMVCHSVNSVNPTTHFFQHLVCMSLSILRRQRNIVERPAVLPLSTPLFVASPFSKPDS
jgi:hypothetical protein